jgi:hypothetical protein
MCRDEGRRPARLAPATWGISTHIARKTQLWLVIAASHGHPACARSGGPSPDRPRDQASARLVRSDGPGVTQPKEFMNPFKLLGYNLT